MDGNNYGRNKEKKMANDTTCCQQLSILSFLKEFLFLLNMVMLYIHIMYGSLMLLQVVVLSKCFPTETHTWFYFLMHRGKMLLRMCLLFECLVAPFFGAFEWPCLSVYHCDMPCQTILKSKLCRTFRAFERPWFFVKCSDMLISGKYDFENNGSVLMSVQLLKGLVVARRGRL